MTHCTPELFAEYREPPRSVEVSEEWLHRVLGRWFLTRHDAEMLRHAWDRLNRLQERIGPDRDLWNARQDILAVLPVSTAEIWEDRLDASET